MTKQLMILFFGLVIGYFNHASAQTVNDSTNYKVDLSESRVYFDSIKLSIIPPKHFVKQDSGFFGFYHFGAGISMALYNWNNRPYVYAGAEFGLIDFEKQGVEMLSTDTLKLNNQTEAIMYLVAFEVQEMKVRRIVLFTGDYNCTIVVYVNYPEKIHPLIYPVLVESLKTLQLEN